MQLAGVNTKVPAGSKPDIAYRNGGQGVSGVSFAGLLQGAKIDALEASGLYGGLSSDAKDLLQKIKKHIPVTKEEWQKLTQELLSKGAITREEFDLTRTDVQLFALPYWAKNGETGHFSHGDGSVMVNSILKLTRGEDPHDWNGQPVDFLNSWLEKLNQMRRERDENGRDIYDKKELDEYLDRISSVQKLLRELLAAV